SASHLEAVLLAASGAVGCGGRVLEEVEARDRILGAGRGEHLAQETLRGVRPRRGGAPAANGGGVVVVVLDESLLDIRVPDRLASLPLLGLDDDDAVGGVGAIERGR